MKWRTVLTWGITILIAVLSGYVFMWIHTNSYQCIQNPSLYGLKELEKANGAPISAVYTVQRQNGGSVILTDSGFMEMKLPSDNESSTKFELNISGLPDAINP